MTKYCKVCKQKIKGNDFVNLKRLNNPLLYGFWCRSCFLAMMCSVLDGMKIEISTLSAKLDYFMGVKGENGNGKEGNSKTDL